MYTRDDSDATLPAVSLRHSGRYRSSRLILTIAFHPDPSRIGESSLIEPQASSGCIELGRAAPLFHRFPVDDEPAGVGLTDSYISRSALSLQVKEGRLHLVRPCVASPVRVDGIDLDGEAELSAKRLRSGIVISLSNRVIILLKALDRELSLAPECGADAALVGSSRYMRRLREQIHSLQHSGDDVLLTGETGTGKGEVARALHGNAPGPFVALNMSALTPGLAAAALFGAQRGAYTGAECNRVGYFQQAGGGTLFLDEIGDTDSEVQPQLLRALEEREIQVVGGPVTSVALRVVAATDADLQDSDSFRSALRYRLARHTLHLWPLREHLEDLGELMLAFIDQLSPQGRSVLQDLQPVEQAMWADVVASFLRYDWPGNIRELRNACGEVLGATGDSLPRIPAWMHDKLRAGPVAGSSVSHRTAAEFSDRDLLDELQRQAWEVAAAARSLGLSRSALNRRLDRIPGIRRAVEIPHAEIAETIAAEGGDIRGAASALRISLSALIQRLRQRELEN